MQTFKRIVENQEEEWVLREQLATFHMKNKLYSITAAQMNTMTKTINWWTSYGSETLELVDVAKKVLS